MCTSRLFRSLGTNAVLLGAVLFLVVGCGGSGGGGGGGNTSTVEPSPWSVKAAPTSWHLYAVHFNDPDNGWVVGEAGTLLRTTDGGETWSDSTPEIPDFLYDVHFTDADNGWIAVDFFDSLRSALLHTTDGGDTWDRVYLGDEFSGPALKSVYFIDSDIGWAFGDGGAIFHTTDGGEDWEEQCCVNADVTAGMFVDEDSGWLTASNGRVYRYVVSAGAWGFQETGVSSRLNDLHFENTTTGWAVGIDGVILHTIDSGSTWTPQDAGTDQTLTSVTFVDTQQGWVSGTDGLILHTADGGQTWTEQDSGSTNSLRDMHFNDADIGWAVGSNGTLIKHVVEDDGDNGDPPVLESGWNHQPVTQVFDDGSEAVLSDTLLTVFPLDNTTGWILTEQRILRTTDGGETWVHQLLGNDDSRRLEDMVFADINHGWAVGEAADDDSRIEHTDDGGESWEKQDLVPPYTPFSGLNSVYFLDANTGWAGGNRVIVTTNDGGANWTVSELFDDVPTVGSADRSVGPLNAIHFTDASNGFVAGGPQWGSHPPVILSTSDGGANWDLHETTGIGTLRAIHFADSNHGWAVGTNNRVLYTENGGQTWADRNTDLGDFTQLHGVYAVGAQSAWIVGQDGILLFTDDGGQSFTEHDSDTFVQLNDVRFTPTGDVGWLGGSGGHFMRYSD